MDQCCRDYLAGLDQLDRQWTAEAAALRAKPNASKSDLSWAASYEEIVGGSGPLAHPPLRAAILSGTYGATTGHPDESCPWDPRYFNGLFADSYRRIVASSADVALRTTAAAVEPMPKPTKKGR